MRRSRRGRLSRSSYFNPRTHVGCDANILSYERFTKISIHAPTWGATLFGFPLLVTFRDFNPRTHVGCDSISPTRPYLTRDFNPRTHVGCDLEDGQAPPRLPSHFNPRTHVGCDGDEGIRTQGGGISIHAPTWGATTSSTPIGQSITISIHAPTWGATITPTRRRSCGQDFNPRTHVGCDLK